MSDYILLAWSVLNAILATAVVVLVWRVWRNAREIRRLSEKIRLAHDEVAA